jgi:hypothetical protein
MNSISRFSSYFVFLALLVSGPANTQTPPASSADPTLSQAGTAPVGRVADHGPDCQAASLSNWEVEVCKLRLQQHQYELDRQKGRDQKVASTLTGVALVASALAGFGAIVFNLVTANRQARLQAKLKALEVVMSASGPNSAKERLKVIEQLLGTGLVPSADKDMVIEGIGVGHDENRRTLLKLLAEYPEHRQEMLADWAIVFPPPNKLHKNIADLQSGKVSSQPKPPPTSPPQRYG